LIRKVAEAVKFLPCIRDVRSSNLGIDIDYSEVLFRVRGFPEFFHINAELVP
jgi:hypothetical protein